MCSFFILFRWSVTLVDLSVVLFANTRLMTITCPCCSTTSKVCFPLFPHLRVYTRDVVGGSVGCFNKGSSPVGTDSFGTDIRFRLDVLNIISSLTWRETGPLPESCILGRPPVNESNPHRPPNPPFFR